MRKIFLAILAITPLSGCGSGVDLCCGYETSQDVTSDVSIVRNGGSVVYQNVSAIIESKDRYAVEIRPFDRNAEQLRYQSCTYAFIDKGSGKTYPASDRAVGAILDNRISNDRRVILKTKNSCIAE